MTEIGPFKVKSTVSTVTSGAVGRAPDAQQAQNTQRALTRHSSFGRFAMLQCTNKVNMTIWFFLRSLESPYSVVPLLQKSTLSYLGKLGSMMPYELVPT